MLALAVRYVTDSGRIAFCLARSISLAPFPISNLEYSNIFLKTPNNGCMFVIQNVPKQLRFHDCIADYGDKDSRGKNGRRA